MKINCGNTYLSVFQDVGDARRYRAFPLRCKSWDCEECRKVKSKEYQNRIRRLFDGRQLYHYTLTYFHSNTPDAAWSTYNQAWNRLRTNLRKQYGRFSYVRVLESHEQSPYPHLHLLVDKGFKVSTFGVSAMSAGFGYQIKIRKVTTAGAMFYLTKYLTKPWASAEGWELRKKYHCRVISFSSDLCEKVKKSKSWEILFMALGLDEAVDIIRTDYTWRANSTYEVTAERSFAGNYETTVYFRMMPPGSPPLTISDVADVERLPDPGIVF